MSRRRTVSWVYLAALCWLTGCTWLHTRAEYDHTFNFDVLRTYDWRPAAQRGLSKSKRETSGLDGRIRTEIENKLAARGYKKTAEDPDFFIGYHVVAGKKVDAATLEIIYGYSGWWHGRPETAKHEYTRGTLLIDVIDARTSRLRWRAAAPNVVDLEDPDQKKRDRKVLRALDEALRDLPPS